MTPTARSERRGRRCRVSAARRSEHRRQQFQAFGQSLGSPTPGSRARHVATSGFCLRKSDEPVPFRRLFASARGFTLVSTAPGARCACLPLRSRFFRGRSTAPAQAVTGAGAPRNDGSGPARVPSGAARTCSATLAISCTRFALAQHAPEAVLDTLMRAADIDAHKGCPPPRGRASTRGPAAGSRA